MASAIPVFFVYEEESHVTTVWPNLPFDQLGFEGGGLGSYGRQLPPFTG